MIYVMIEGWVWEKSTGIKVNPQLFGISQVQLGAVPALPSTIFPLRNQLWEVTHQVVIAQKEWLILTTDCWSLK